MLWWCAVKKITGKNTPHFVISKFVSIFLLDAQNCKNIVSMLISNVISLILMLGCFVLHYTNNDSILFQCYSLTRNILTKFKAYWYTPFFFCNFSKVDISSNFWFTSPNVMRSTLKEKNLLSY